MARFSVSVRVPADAGRTWAALTDWPSHGDWIPATTVRVTSERPDGVGASFATRSGIGPLGFDDPMVVTAWQPPADGRAGHCAVRKTGRVVLGGAEFDVVPLGPAASLVHWSEDVQVPPVALTRHLGPLVGAVGGLLFRLALGRFARYVAAGRDLTHP